MLLFRFNVSVHCNCIVFIALRDLGGRRFISTVFIIIIIIIYACKILRMCRQFCTIVCVIHMALARTRHACHFDGELPFFDELDKK